jgi:hypothetical protein
MNFSSVSPRACSRFFALLALVVLVPLRANANVYWVDTDNPSASDRGPGSESIPFKTISRAAKDLKPGDNVLVRPGVYREEVQIRASGTKELPIRFFAEKPGTVIVTGADVIKDFSRVQSDEPIYRVTWPHVFAIDHRDGKPIEHHPDDAPLWGRAEQVIVGGKQLLPVSSEKELRAAKSIDPPLPKLGGPFAGHFFADSKSHLLMVKLADGSDPNQHRVEASTRGQIFGISEFASDKGVSFVEAHGFIFRYAANFPQRAAVVLHGHDNLVEDCVIEDMAGQGVAVDGTLRTCTIRNNGHIGGSAIGDHFLNEDCVWEGNSWKPISRNWEAGGAKVVLARGGTFRDCLFRRNGGPGLWFDIDCKGILVTNCVFDENEKSGLFIEISRDVTAVRNLLRRNAIAAVGQREKADWSSAGIQLGESEDCVIAFNTCAGNREGITLREQGPRATKTREGTTIDYHNTGHVIARNLLKGNEDHALGLWYDNAFFSNQPSTEPVYDPRKQNLTIRGNKYEDMGTNPAVLYGAPWLDKHQTFGDVKSFSDATGFESDENPTGDEAGWSDAPDDIDAWVKNFLPAWQR